MVQYYKSQNEVFEDYAWCGEWDMAIDKDDRLKGISILFELAGISVLIVNASQDVRLELHTAEFCVCSALCYTA